MTLWQKIKAALRRLWPYAPHINPTVIACVDRDQAETAAKTFAYSLPASLIYPIDGTTGSMFPLIPRQECFAVAKRVAWADVKLGTVVIYRPQWNLRQPVCHRLVAKDGLGFIASGDANKRSESWERVTEETFDSEVIAIWTVAST